MFLKVFSISIFVLLSGASVFLTSLYIRYRESKSDAVGNKVSANEKMTPETEADEILTESASRELNDTQINSRKESNGLSRAELLVYIIVTMLISLVAGLLQYDNVTSLLSFYKIVLIYVLTSAIAITDFKLRIIPNLFTLMLLSGGIIFHVTDILFLQHDNRDIIQEILFYNIAAAIGVVVILWVLSLVTRSGMGFGDIKYLGALCFVGGITLLLITLMVSLFFSLVTGLVFVVAKKKKMKDTIPFGPFMMLGVVSCVFTGLM